MRIEHTHQMSKDEIKKRGDVLTDTLVTMPLPADASIGNIARAWHDYTMDFSFRVSQGFFGVDIKGQLLVTDSTVVLDLKLPPIVSSFIDKDRIQGSIQKKMAEILA